MKTNKQTHKHIPQCKSKKHTGFSLSLIPDRRERGKGRGHCPNLFQMAPETSQISCRAISWPHVPRGLIIDRTLEHQMFVPLFLQCLDSVGSWPSPGTQSVQVSCCQQRTASAYMCYRDALVPGPIPLPTLVTVLSACKYSMDPGMWIAEVTILRDALLMLFKSFGGRKRVHSLDSCPHHP